METEGPPQPPHPGEAPVAVDAVIDATADGRMRLSLEDGSVQQLTAPEEISELLGRAPGGSLSRSRR